MSTGQSALAGDAVVSPIAGSVAETRGDEMPRTLSGAVVGVATGAPQAMELPSPPEVVNAMTVHAPSSITQESIGNMMKAELKKALQARGLAVSGKKQELKDRLLEAANFV